MENRIHAHRVECAHILTGTVNEDAPYDTVNNFQNTYGHNLAVYHKARCMWPYFRLSSKESL